MPDIFYLISRWWKQMLVVIIIALVTVGAIVFFLPTKYLSVATALPANPALTDKSSVFSENIQIPSPSLGTEEELDMIVGTGQLDTVYIAVATAFNLWDHYKTEERGDAAVTKAAYLLKKNSGVSKSGYGELKVKVWDTDKNLAPQLANAIIDLINRIHSGLHSGNNKAVLTNLQASMMDIGNQIDSIENIKAGEIIRETAEWNTKALNELRTQLQEYGRLLAEYQLMINTKPDALVIVEKARPSPWPDKPKRALILVSTAVLSFLFSLLVALVIERRKRIV